LEVQPRGRSTLVSWSSADPDADVARLADLGIVVRSIVSHKLVRASVGAWSSEEELERLAEAAVS
jgi:selenocysteine lyase/cysteine desulfurase